MGTGEFERVFLCRLDSFLCLAFSLWLWIYKGYNTDCGGGVGVKLWL